MSRTTTIGQICRVITGKLDANASSQNGAYPFFTCSINPLRIDTFAYDLECVLIAGNGDLNVKYYKGKFNAYQRTYIVSLKDGVNDVSVKFLHAFFLLYVDVLRKKSVGSTIKYIRLGDITEAAIVIPSLSEQQRIVDILDQEFAKIDVLKANSEKSIQAAKDLFQATLKKELEPKDGWRTEAFGNVCQYHKEQGLFPSLRYVGMDSIESESGVLLGTIPGEQVQSSSFHFYPGDVLYGRLRPYLKKVVVADFEGCCSTEIFPVRSKECIPLFLQYWFLATDTTNKINATCSGCRMPRANMKDVLSFDISFPDKREQEEVVNRIKALCDRVKTLQDNYQKTTTLCVDLKQALLRNAFNGKL